MVVDDIFMLVVTFIASLGFALFFNVYRSHLMIASVGGVITWAIYKLGTVVVGGVFVPCLIASIFAAAYAELLAWHSKAPTPIFFIISVIPLVPGRVLFYTMSEAVALQWESCAQYAVTTLEFTAAIAAGICIVTAVVQTYKIARIKLKEQREARPQDNA